MTKKSNFLLFMFTQNGVIPSIKLIKAIKYGINEIACDFPGGKYINARKEFHDNLMEEIKFYNSFDQKVREKFKQIWVENKGHPNINDLPSKLAYNFQASLYGYNTGGVFYGANDKLLSKEFFIEVKKFCKRHSLRLTEDYAICREEIDLLSLDEYPPYLDNY